MLLGEVIGTVVATQKNEDLSGAKFLIVEQLDHKALSSSNFLVAVDSVGAGEGDVVLYSIGSAARFTGFTSEKPVDAVIIGIVDSWEIRGERKYEKFAYSTATAEY